MALVNSTLPPNSSQRLLLSGPSTSSTLMTLKP